MINHQGYSAAVSLWKAFWTFVQVSFGVGGGVLAIKTPATFEELKEVWPTLAIPLLLAVFRAVENLRKNYRADGRVLWRWPLDWFLRGASLTAVFANLLGL